MRNWLLSKKYKQHNVILSKQITCLPEEPNKHYCKENRDKSSKKKNTDVEKTSTSIINCQENKNFKKRCDITQCQLEYVLFKR